MLLYFCECCNFSSNLKSNFKRHLNTEKHKKNYKEKGVELAKKNTKRIKNVIKGPQMTPNDPKKGQKTGDLGSSMLKNRVKNLFLTYKEIGVKKITCIYCEKEFTTKAHLGRHLRNSCKNHPKNGKNHPKNGKNHPKNGHALIPPNEIFTENSENWQNNENEILSNSEKIVKNSEKMVLNLLEQQRKIFNEERKGLYKHINKLLNKVGNTTITTTTNTNIQLNSYGSEDLTHITDNFKTHMLKIPYGAIPKMIEAVHFNDKKPENKNIVLSNKRDNKLKIFSGNKWIYKNKDDALKNLINGKYFILDNHYETICDKLKIINYEDFRAKYDIKDKDILNKLKIDSELVLLNNR